MNSEAQINSVLTPWWKSGLFWRTFALLAFLISVSMGAWVLSFRMVEREPFAQRAANQLVSIVTITRAALIHSAPDLRRELLFDLASNEGIRIYTLELSDEVELLPEDGQWPMLLRLLRSKLGEDTRISRKVNGIEGFWISFKIDDEDEYWLVLPVGRLEGPANWQWLWWAAAGFGLSLMGAGFISGLINQPLARLAIAARTFAGGRTPGVLPETGSAEVRDANRSFNQMVSELERNEKERMEVLAGISHDLRTPLTRIQLELEMSSLSEEEKGGMEADVRQMDAIVGQFLDYARLSGPKQNEAVNISLLLEETAEKAARSPDLVVWSQIAPDLFVRGNQTDFERVFSNLVSNAERYGHSERTGMVELSLDCRRENDEVVVIVSDRGPGIAEEDRERLLRPFTRKNTARSEAGGSGLGLAIVNRIVQRYRGRLALESDTAGGLVVRMVFPAAEKEKA